MSSNANVEKATVPKETSEPTDAHKRKRDRDPSDRDLSDVAERDHDHVFITPSFSRSCDCWDYEISGECWCPSYLN